MAVVIPFIPAIISAIGVGYSIYSGNKQQRETKKAAALTAKARTEQKIQTDLSNLRARRGAARESIAARSLAVSAGAQDSGVQTSAVAGAISSIGTQGAANASYLDQLGASQGRELAFNISADAVFGRIQRLKNRRNIISSVATLAQNKSIQTFSNKLFT